MHTFYQVIAVQLLDRLIRLQAIPQCIQYPDVVEEYGCWDILDERFLSKLISF